MTSLGVQRRSGDLTDEDGDAPTAPSTPQESGPAPPLSQVTLPSTEAPGSPVDVNASFKTEFNDERQTTTVIPSSLTPPPSSQTAMPAGNPRRAALTHSQQTNLYSPPATVLNNPREGRNIENDYVPPAPRQVLGASADELRAMLQTCIAEHQKLKMETAHHRLQYNLLSLQADEESKRAAVEHDMVRREVDALRMAEHSRQARRELSSSADSMQSKYLQMKVWYEAALEDNEILQRRLRVAKKVIQQKEEETIGLTEEREMLLNRIRENREHFHMLCSPGGIFHGALTPTPNLLSTPVQQVRATPRQVSRSSLRDGQEHGLSALLQAMSQTDQNNNNNSAPTTPVQKVKGRRVTKHSRNAQSMSSVPTTPLSRSRGGEHGLLPSVSLVPQTEPRMRYSQKHFEPTTPVSKTSDRRKSRESTISVEDNEELARQALVSAAVSSQPLHQAGQSQRGGGPSQSGGEDVFDSQASQAATEMLRRHPGQSFEVASSNTSREQSPEMAPSRLQSKLSDIGRGDKRRLGEMDEEHGSPPKKVRLGGELTVSGRRVGLGIQYHR